MLPLSFYLTIYEICIDKIIKESKKASNNFVKVKDDILTLLKIQERLNETFGFENSFVVIQTFTKITIWVS